VRVPSLRYRQAFLAWTIMVSRCRLSRVRPDDPEES
jgi:hypothetical protein